MKAGINSDSKFDNMMKRFGSLTLSDSTSRATAAKELKSKDATSTLKSNNDAMNNKFADNFLSPKEAESARKYAIKALKSKQKCQLTKYNEYYVVTINEGNDIACFALKNLNVEPGAQGTVSIAQELFSDKKQNQKTNTFLCKSSSKVLSFADFKNESSFLKLFNKFRAATQFTHGDTSYYFQFAHYVAGESLSDICYYKDEKKNFHKKELDPLFIVKTSREVIDAYITFYETYGVLHGDVKLSNLVKNENGVELIDFGSTTFPLNAKRIIYGTPGNQAPELASYSLNQEVFSMGLVLAELLTKYNYKAFVNDFMNSLSMYDNWLQVIPFEKTMQALPDIYGFSINDDKNLRWDLQLCTMIRKMTDINPICRPNVLELRTMRKNLKALEIKLSEKSEIFLPVRDLTEITNSKSSLVNLSVENLVLDKKPSRSMIFSELNRKKSIAAIQDLQFKQDNASYSKLSMMNTI